MPACREESQQDDGERGGFLVVPPLEKRGDDADEKRGDGEVVRGVEAAAEAVCEDEECRARQACDEVGRLDDRERDQVSDESQPEAHLRRRAGEEQDHAADEGRDREECGCGEWHPTARDASGARQPRLAARKLAGREQHERDRERKEIVDDAEYDHRAEEPGGLDMAAEQRDECELEHTQAAGHVAYQAGHLRKHECGEHDAEGHVRRRLWQHGPEHRGHEQPVHDRNGDLRHRDPARRRNELPPEYANRAAEPCAREEVGRDREQQERADGPQARERHAEDRVGPAGREEERPSGDRQHAQPERHGVEGDREGDVRARKSGRVVEPVAQAAAQQQREAECVGE